MVIRSRGQANHVERGKSSPQNTWVYNVSGRLYLHRFPGLKRPERSPEYFQSKADLGADVLRNLQSDLKKKPKKIAKNKKNPSSSSDSKSFPTREKLLNLLNFGGVTGSEQGQVQPVQACHSKLIA